MVSLRDDPQGPSPLGEFTTLWIGLSRFYAKDNANTMACPRPAHRGHDGFHPCYLWDHSFGGTQHHSERSRPPYGEGHVARNQRFVVTAMEELRLLAKSLSVMWVNHLETILLSPDCVPIDTLTIIRRAAPSQRQAPKLLLNSGPPEMVWDDKFLLFYATIVNW